MATCNIISWNIRGLNSKFKRSLLFSYLKKYTPSMVLLQETHLMGQKVLSLKKPWVGWAYHATFTSHSRGVTILIRKNTPFELINLITDHYGRFIILARL
uniref:Endonuclease/exonuclease/phosphatase domain-containing protein n=1 Tax=Xenopus tropicalis TaxID=8364 RepID=A0A803JF65_XENTR